MRRLRGHNLRRIDYQHVIWSLVRKPSGFSRYVYREESVSVGRFSARVRRDPDTAPRSEEDLEYLRVLHLAASTIEADVEAALTLLLADGGVITADAVKALVATATQIVVPDLVPPPVDLRTYDALLAEVGT